MVIDKQNQIYISNYLGKRVDIYRLINSTAEDSFVNGAKTPEKKEEGIQ